MRSRIFVTEALAETLGDDWRVLSTNGEVTPSGPTVICTMGSRARTSGLQMEDTISVVVLSNWQVAEERISETETVLDALEDLMEEVTEALEETQGVLWSTAEYGVYQDSYPCFVINAVVPTRKKFK